ncbi:MAG: hypothetical protein AB8C02_12040 [Halioglobus sp.]
MSGTATQAIEQDKFLILAANLLHKALVEPSRTSSKRLYRELEKGQAVPLASVEMEDKSQARFTLALEHSEFCGRLNFGAFQASVKTLLSNIVKNVKEKQDLRVFNAQEETGAMIFGITGVTMEAEQANVMVLAAQPSPDAQMTTLQLMYLDPTQFTEAAQA